MQNELSKALIRLYESERFYAEILLQMERFSSKRIPTLAVCIKDRIQLYVNTEFFATLSNEEQVAVLKHECQHILFDHIGRSKEIAPEVYNSKSEDHIDNIINSAKHQLINIAADCAINPGIQNLPNMVVRPGQFGLEDGHLMEWYVENLKDNEKLKGLTTVGDHSLWAESEGDKEAIKEKVRQAINKAASNARASGNLSAEHELLIERLNHVPKDWKGDLRRFAAKTQFTTLESSRKKRNRRYGIMYPGHVKDDRLHIGVAVDTSGSISDEALTQFFAEIANIAKYAIVTVVEADAEVKNSYVFDPKKQYKASGRGGTAYQPAFDYFLTETDVDGVIYFGDMDCCDTDEIKKPAYPVMWAVVGNQSPPAVWGSRTIVEIKKK